MCGYSYETGILLSQERLEKLPLLDRVEEWLNTTDALFAGAVYGTTLVEVATLLASYDTLKLSMTAKQEVRPLSMPVFAVKRLTLHARRRSTPWSRTKTSSTSAWRLCVSA